MKQLSHLLTLLFVFIHLNGKAQTDIQRDKRVDPVLKLVDAKLPGLKMFSRKDGKGRYVNMAVLNESTRQLKWFTCYGVAFDSAQLRNDEYSQLATGTIDAFTFYRNYSHEKLFYIEQAELLYRLNGKASLQDSSYNNRVVFNAAPVKSAQSTLQKLMAMEGLMKRISLQLQLFDSRTPLQLAKNRNDSSSRIRQDFAGVMINKADGTEYYNTSPLATAAKIVLRQQSPNRLFVYDQDGVLRDSVPLKPGKYASLLKEKEDVFLLYRGWLELQWQQVAEGKRQYAVWLRKLDSSLYRSVSWAQSKLQLLNVAVSLQEQEITIDEKISSLIVPEKRHVEQLLADFYRNETSEISYLSGLGFAYTISYIRGQKAYELTEHRGNVMAVVSDKKKGVDENTDGTIEYYDADVVNSSDYYPFGASMPGRTFSVEKKYRYGYNGKENDNEVKGEGNQQDYGMRIYDARVGRFLSIDPITKQYPELSPYQFASNRVIDGIDLDGLEFTPGMYDYKSALYIGNLTMPTEKKLNQQQIEVWGNAMNEGSRKGSVAGAALAVDAYTGGRFSLLLSTAQLYGAFHHNKASTPEGRGIQEEESKNAVVGAALGWGFSKIVGGVIRLGWTLKEEVKYLFRGTSEGFEGLPSLQRLSVTPTSSDPVVATIFATNAENYGNGILQVALPKDLQGVGFTSNVLSSLEKEIAVGLKPAEFTSRASVTITAKDARNILEGMGIKLPSKVSLDEISNTIRNTPRLNQSQIDEFYQKVGQLKNQ